ncbi:topology modulation protein [Weizmannia acidilactici]|uniref:Topology modulation protein n=2 Tax=Weizmannia acidilactici TaxID=2607726 RepID=A0A5J4JMB6_9BACI|nr:topology modulation protein [Weizmannia acidilactici]GER70144.1 topology modulation protein [Weizmannia acidilactici]
MMKRILVIGVSAGAGKSTFARRLGEKLGIEVIHLDALFWKPGWKEASLEEFRASQMEVVQKDTWIMEGNYSNSIDIREAAADTVFYLELPLLVCLYRVVKRRILNHGKTRPDMGKGCEEKLDFKFLKFIVSTYHSRKKKMVERIESYKQMGKTVIVLKGRKQINAFLKNMTFVIYK